MTPPRTHRRTWVRRALWALLVSLAHVMLLVAFLVTAPKPPVVRPDPPMLLSLGRGPGSQAPPKPSTPTAAKAAEPPPLLLPVPADIALPAPPPDPAPAPQASAPESVAPAAASSSATSGAAGGDDCDILVHLQQRLQGDGVVLKALRAIPRSARSVANAIQLWDGAWANPASVGGAQVFEPIRDAVVQTVRAAPESCQRQQVAGPRLIAVPDGAGTTMVGLGSGIWSWKDLVQESAPDGGRSPV